MVPYLAKKWTSQAIIWMSYPHARSRLTHLQAQVSGTCEAGLFLLPGLLSFQERTEICILSQRFHFQNFCKLFKILKHGRSLKMIQV